MTQFAAGQPFSEWDRSIVTRNSAILMPWRLSISSMILVRTGPAISHNSLSALAYRKKASPSMHMPTSPKKDPELNRLHLETRRGGSASLCAAGRMGGSVGTANNGASGGNGRRVLAVPHVGQQSRQFLLDD